MPEGDDTTSHEVDTSTSGCTPEVSPSKVDSGANLTLKGKTTCSSLEDLRGEGIRVLDQKGALVESSEIIDFDGETNETSEFVVKAPVLPGAYTWVMVCPGCSGRGVAESIVPFSFEVKPHDTSVVVWSVPPTIECGEKFSVKIGVKCSSECRPAPWTVEIRDEDGGEQGTSTVAGERWPGTSALYYTETELSAPDKEGLYLWEAKLIGDGLAVPHTECISSFSVRVVPIPECVLTIEAIDIISRDPVEGARVVVHPYEGLTDETGIAELRIPKGGYQLFVSGKEHFPVRIDGDIKEDIRISVELRLDLELSDADVWL